MYPCYARLVSCTTLLQQRKRLFYLLALFVLSPSFLHAENLPLDVDGNGVVNANDGVLILRRLNGGSTIDTGLTLPTSATNRSVVATIDQAGTKFDVDGNSRVDANDGVLISRCLNGNTNLLSDIVLPSGKNSNDVVLAMVALGCVSEQVISLNAQKYYPLVAGTVWTYQEETGQKQPTVSVAQGTEVFNGKETKTVLYAGGTLPDRQENYSNDEGGLLLHHLSYVNTRGEANDLVFDTPLVIARATIVTGETISTEGSATAKKTYADGTWIQVNASFSATSEVVGVERVTVPAGQFVAVRVERLLSLVASGYDVLTTSTFWFSEAIGIVKEVSLISGMEVSTALVGGP